MPMKKYMSARKSNQHRNSQSDSKTWTENVLKFIILLIQEESYTLEPLSLTFIETVNVDGDISDSEPELTLVNSSSELDKPTVSQTPAHVLPTTSSHGGSSEGSCTIGGSEEVLRGGDTSSLSEKTSVPSTPLENRFPSHCTHSRNVSETPSLPPFVSSSSSSAYHSRNSSMASQITSDCFESDSQFTDIDSCIVTYSSDIHRPISLQEARFKFPEMSAMEKSIQRQCYAISDINMTTPICVPEHLFVPSPPLDETLTTGEEPQRSIPIKNFEGKQLLVAALKSSEWIKREMRRSRQTMIQVMSKYYVCVY